MDQDIVRQLEAKGMSTDPSRLSVGVARMNGTPIHDDEPGVVVGDHTGTLRLQLKPISALFVGNRQPPPFRGEPPAEYIPFFHAIEHTAAVACAARRRPERDEEFERLYRHLRRRPDGSDANPIFDALQNSARMYMSLRDVSRAEFEAVMDRLSRSARTFRTHVASTSYFNNALAPLLRG
jgi:hypothetical protein